MPKAVKNIFINCGDFIKGYTTNTNKEFCFDAEDMHLVSRYTWYEERCQSYSSVRAWINGRHIRLTQLLGYRFCDHIDRNPFNNRRNNLRESTRAENSRNHHKPANSSSGVAGVSFNNQLKKWDAYIWVSNKKQRIGSYELKDEAIKARLEQEKNIYGEYAPQRHLYKKYGVI